MLLKHISSIACLMRLALSRPTIAILSFFFRRKQCHRTAFNFLTVVHGRRQSPPVISTARQFRAGVRWRIERARELSRRPNVTLSRDADAGRRRPLAETPDVVTCRPERGACSPDRNVVGELPGDDNACNTSRFRVCSRRQDLEYPHNRKFIVKYGLSTYNHFQLKISIKSKI